MNNKDIQTALELLTDITGLECTLVQKPREWYIYNGLCQYFVRGDDLETLEDTLTNVLRYQKK